MPTPLVVSFTAMSLAPDSSPIADCCVMLIVYACIGVIYLYVSNARSLVTEKLTRLQIPSYS